eukprot:340546-Prorocentrum_minimum.AAC.2
MGAICNSNMQPNMGRTIRLVLIRSRLRSMLPPVSEYCIGFQSNAQARTFSVGARARVRYKSLLDILLKHEKHVMFGGPTGTGKTVYIKVKNAAIKPLLSHSTTGEFNSFPQL